MDSTSRQRYTRLNAAGQATAVGQAAVAGWMNDGRTDDGIASLDDGIAGTGDSGASAGDGRVDRSSRG